MKSTSEVVRVKQAFAWIEQQRAIHLKAVTPKGEPVELSADEAVPVLRAWPVRIPQGAKIMRDGGVVPDLEPDTFAALAGRCAVFRIESV